MSAIESWDGPRRRADRPAVNQALHQSTKGEERTVKSKTQECSTTPEQERIYAYLKPEKYDRMKPQQSW